MSDDESFVVLGSSPLNSIKSKGSQAVDIDQSNKKGKLNKYIPNKTVYKTTPYQSCNDFITSLEIVKYFIFKTKYKQRIWQLLNLVCSILVKLYFQF